MTFDPKTVTLDDCAGLTIEQARMVVESCGFPPLSKSVKSDDARGWARGAVSARMIQTAQVAGEPVAAIAAGDPDAVLLEEPPTSVLPTEKRFEYVVRLGEWLANSKLTPEILRNKPEDVVAVLLRANDLGIPLTQGLDQLYVVHGKVGMEGKMMRALVRRNGHSIVDLTDYGDSGADDWWDRWTCIGKRCDGAQDEQRVTFTLDDAVDWKVIDSYRRGDNGRAIVVGKDQWKKMPRTMLKWRATAEMCRDLFSDCLAGVAYTPEEMDFAEYVPEAGSQGARNGETLTAAQQRSDLAQRIADLDDDFRDEVKAEWKRLGLSPLVKTDHFDPIAGTQIGQAVRLVTGIEAKQTARDAERDAGIDEADVVPSCGICGTTDEAAIATGADGGVRCTDTEACMARVSEAARAKAEMERPFTDDPAPPGEAPPVGMCNEAGGCPNVAVADGYCADHQPM